MNVTSSLWRSINLEISRFLQRYHRFERGKSFQVSDLRFSSHGSLIIGFNDTLCFIPKNRMFVQEEDTGFLPVPLYHPAFLQELLMFGRVQVCQSDSSLQINLMMTSPKVLHHTSENGLTIRKKDIECLPF